MKHTLLPTIPENFFDSHKSPFGIFCETHKGLALSDEEIKKENELRDLEIQINGYINEYIEKLSKTYKRLLNADIKSVQNAINLMCNFMWECKGAVSIPVCLYPAKEAEKESAYLAEKIDNWFEYFSKLAAKADNAAHGMGIAPKSPNPLPEQEKSELEILNYFADNGMIKTKDGMIEKRDGKCILTDSTRKVIIWFFYNNSPLDLTPRFFMDNFLNPKGMPLDIETIKKYFRDGKETAKFQKDHPESNINTVKN